MSCSPTSQHDLRWWLSVPAGLAVTFTAAAMLRVARARLISAA